ncbi:hypothetical protein [Streptomyces fumanus]|nr:hypothetical protein [Streptomyces fumanus]
MSTPGRGTCASCTAPGRDRTPGRLTRAVRWAGRLLCWSLAAGMATAATHLLLAPRAAWWHAVWLLPWYLTCAAALTWAVLRAREKAAQHPPDDDTRPDHWDRAA